MNRSAMATVAVVLVLVLVVVGVAAVVGLGTNGATAVEVGSQKVSREDVNDELRAVADNEQLVKQVGADRVTTTRGSLVADAAAAVVMNGTVQEALINEYLDRKGEKVTAEDQAAGKELFAADRRRPVRGGLPEVVPGALGRAARRVQRLRPCDRDRPAVHERGGRHRRELRPFARKVGVKVDPRYGRYSSSKVDRRPVHAARRSARPERLQLTGLVVPKIVVVGLGPAGADLLLPAARAALDAHAGPVRRARPAIPPSTTSRRTA